MYQTWWKVLAVVLVFYTLIAGFLLHVPVLPILHETIRNLYFHVPMWFAMLAVFVISVFYSV
ncbi:MAG: ABC transporter permease, partial [Mucilaginibacter sp.]